MKKYIEKIANVLGWIFGYGMMISLFIGGISAVGYIIALIIGGDTAGAICKFIYKDVYPILVFSTSVILLLGILKMYLTGQFALSASKKKK